MIALIMAEYETFRGAMSRFMCQEKVVHCLRRGGAEAPDLIFPELAATEDVGQIIAAPPSGSDQTRYERAPAPLLQLAPYSDR